MIDHRGHIEHHPVVGAPAAEGEVRAILVFDVATGALTGASPHVQVEQTDCEKTDGTITTTLEIKPIGES